MGPLDCFHVLATVNSAAMNIGVHVSFQIRAFVFFGYMPRSGTAGSYGNSIFPEAWFPEGRDVGTIIGTSPEGVTGQWFGNLGIRGCVESLPDGSCDLRLRDAVPAPTLQEESTAKERKGDSNLAFVLPSDLLLCSALAESRGTLVVIHGVQPSRVQSRAEKGGERVWRGLLKTLSTSSEVRSWLT